MRVLAYDPYLSATRARSFQVELIEELDELLAAADFITLHTPLTPETHHLLERRATGENEARRADDQLRARRLDRRSGACRGVAQRPGRSRGARCFRNGTAAGRFTIARAAESRPHSASRRLDREAQESVGIEIAQSIRAALLEGTIRNAVNMPNLDAKTLAIVGPHLRFGEKLGRFLSQSRPERVEQLNINYSGKVNEVDTTAITRSVLKGSCNTPAASTSMKSTRRPLPKALALKITESRLSAPGDYTDLLELSASRGRQNAFPSPGAFFGATPADRQHQ